MFPSFCGWLVASGSKKKSGRGHVWPGWFGVRCLSHPKASPKEAPAALLQLPDGCGGNRNDRRTLICLINSLCSRVVAIRPAVWAALGAGQGSSRLLAPCLPNHCQALCPWGEGPGKGVSLAADFLSFRSLIHSQFSTDVY